jgi:formylglycine-generating enzyme required for sulfatase activity
MLAEEAKRRDPAQGVKPGSGQSFRDCPECPEMVVVPKGSFIMGSPADEKERISGEDQVSVTIAKPFAAGKFAVTRGEFAAFVEATGHKSEGCYAFFAGVSWRSPGFTQDDRHPVVCLIWDDAKAYTAWLSKKTGKDYRLLSEAEREYAARAGTTTPFWWGESISTGQANYSAKGEHRQSTLPVDSFKPNPWGLYNVHGNVCEWTEDCWNDSNSGNPGDGSARTAGDCSRRVVRGGSWNHLASGVRAAYRSRPTTGYKINDFGFRVGRAL